MEVTTVSLLASFALLCFAFRRMRIRRNELYRRRKCRETAAKQLLLCRNFLRQVRNDRSRCIATLILSRKRNARKRSVWTRPRSSAVFETMWENFSSKEWKENFRVDRETFTFICNRLRPIIEKQDTVMRRAVSVEKRVAIALWRLATNAEYRTIGTIFGVGRNTASNIVYEVCTGINNVFLEEYLKLPEDEQVTEIVRGFENRWGFPQCVGAIDGSHIPIISPKDRPADYYNRKGFHSIVLQAIVDFRYRFIDVYVGWPGKCHDARILKNSAIFRKARAGTLLPNLHRTICGQDVPLLLLGDPAYPLYPWLMKGFPDTGHLTRDQSQFNYRLSRARMVVENAFGRLKGRWRSLLKRNDTSLERLPKYVLTCCILHNICEVRKDNINDNWVEEAVQQQQFNNPNNPIRDDTDGRAIREAIVRHFAEGF